MFVCVCMSYYEIYWKTDREWTRQIHTNRYNIITIIHTVSISKKPFFYPTIFTTYIFITTLFSGMESGEMRKLYHQFNVQTQKISI